MVLGADVTLDAVEVQRRSAMRVSTQLDEQILCVAGHFIVTSSLQIHLSKHGRVIPPCCREVDDRGGESIGEERQQIDAREQHGESVESVCLPFDCRKQEAGCRMQEVVCVNLFRFLFLFFIGR